MGKFEIKLVYRERNFLMSLFGLCRIRLIIHEKKYDATYEHEATFYVRDI